MQPAKTKTTLLYFLQLILVVFFVLFAYTFTHEGGHALIGVLCGQSLTEFNTNFFNFGAHVSLSGGNLSQAQLALRSIAGAGLPFLLWVLFILLVPRRGSFTLEVLKIFSFIMIVNTLLVWIVIPILFLSGNAPPSDDVTHFLRYSQFSPLLLAAAAAILYACGWMLFLSKIQGLKNEFLLFRTRDYETITAGMKTTFPVISAALVIILVLNLVISRGSAAKAVDQFSPPSNAVLLAQVDLSVSAHTSETITQFSLDETSFVSIFILIRDINTPYFDLAITGPDDYRVILYHGEEYSAGQSSGLWEENLPPGTYRLVLTADQSPGVVSIYKLP